MLTHMHLITKLVLPISVLVCALSNDPPQEENAVEKPDLEIIEGKVFKDLEGCAIQLRNRKHVCIRNCRFENVGVAVRLHGCRHISIQDCHMKDLTIQGIDIREGCTDIQILNNHLDGFRDDVQGGHFISTEKTESPKQFRITISNNTLLGNKKSFVRNRKNGASGDMLALRSVSGFKLIGNQLTGGGEFGMTCLYGSENGVIAQNTIREIDGTGLLVAYQCKNINVHGNTILDVGHSFETDGSKNDLTHQAGIFCRGDVENVLITGNLIVREKSPEMRYGIQLRETKGVIKANLIRGVEKEIHIARKLQGTVDVEFDAEK